MWNAGPGAASMRHDRKARFPPLHDRISVYRPMQPMFEHFLGFGYLLVGAIFLMEFIGILLIRKIVNIDV